MLGLIGRLFKQFLNRAEDNKTHEQAEIPPAAEPKPIKIKQTPAEVRLAHYRAKRRKKRRIKNAMSKNSRRINRGKR